MIGRLVGKIVADDPPHIVLEVGGVGYELTCPLGTPGRAERSASGEVILSVHTALRQDALELFGFASSLERLAFRRLINIPGVGPRLAVAVLSVLPPDELAEVIGQEDAAKLTKVPGVGKKTAERILLELRGKVDFAVSGAPGTPAASVPNPKAIGEKLASALTGLGYKTAEAERAVTQVLAEEPESLDLSTLLRKALHVLGS
ncbi:MAG: Holliday junction branch migration protein RuvA [Sorangiineae bacterium NIC37A_2]|nr:MAG: Holliday junction branch migration protein RuvA [Sorangiineae bacterium NIC37A_2]